MKNLWILFLIPVLAVLSISAACMPSAPAPTVAPKPTVASTQTPQPTTTPAPTKEIKGSGFVRQGQKFFIKAYDSETRYGYVLEAGLKGLQLITEAGTLALDAKDLVSGIEFYTFDGRVGAHLGPLYYLDEQQSWFVKIVPVSGRTVYVENIAYTVPGPSDVIKGAESVEFVIDASAVLATLGTRSGCVDGLDVSSLWGRGRLPATGGKVVFTVPKPVAAMDTHVSIWGAHDFKNNALVLGEMVFEFNGDFARFSGGKAIAQFEMKQTTSSLSVVCAK